MNTKFIYGVIIVIAIGFFTVAYKWCPWNWHSAVVTQSGSISLSSDVNPDAIERIYSGIKENVILTINLIQGAGTVEVLVNDVLITDGTIEKVGWEARTFKLRDVQTIDVRLKSTSAAVPAGEYTISVPLD